MLILFPLAFCLSRACFARSIDRSTKTLIFDPIMGIFTFSDPRRWRVKEVEFSKNLFTSIILIYSDSEFHFAPLRLLLDCRCYCFASQLHLAPDYCQFVIHCVQNKYKRGSVVFRWHSWISGSELPRQYDVPGTRDVILSHHGKISALE